MNAEIARLARIWSDELTLDQREKWRDAAPDGLLGFNYFVECKGEKGE